MNINFDDYLVSFDMRIDRNFKAEIKRVINATRKIGFVIDGLDNFTIPVSKNTVVSFRTKFKRGKRRTFHLLAKNQERFAAKIVPGIKGSSSPTPLARQTIKAMQTVRDLIIDRFDSSGLQDITGQLSSAIHGMGVVYSERQSTGVSAATANWNVLNFATPPYTIDSEGDTEHRSTEKIYSYTVGTATIPTTGYWAFQQFGTSNGVDARVFILDLNDQIYGSDQIILNYVEDWISAQIDEFNAKNLQIAGR